MSYDIYKSFSIKNGKEKVNVASSNLFETTIGNNDRTYEKRIFFKHERDFRVDLPTIVIDNETIINPYYNLSDIEIYTKRMLESIYFGDRFYQTKHKIVIRTVNKWANNIISKDYETFAKNNNITIEYIDANMYHKEFKDKYGEFDSSRIYKNPTKSEFTELVNIVKETLNTLKNERKNKT